MCVLIGVWIGSNFLYWTGRHDIVGTGVSVTGQTGRDTETFLDSLDGFEVCGERNLIFYF